MFPNFLNEISIVLAFVSLSLTGLIIPGNVVDNCGMRDSNSHNNTSSALVGAFSVV